MSKASKIKRKELRAAYRAAKESLRHAAESPSQKIQRLNLRAQTRHYQTTVLPLQLRIQELRRIHPGRGRSLSVKAYFHALKTPRVGP